MTSTFAKFESRKLAYHTPPRAPVAYTVWCTSAVQRTAPQAGGVVEERVEDRSLHQLAEKSFQDRLGCILCAENLRRVYAVDGHNSGGIIPLRSQFTGSTTLSADVKIFHPEARPNRGYGRFEYNGVELHPFEGFIATTEGDPLIVVNGHGISGPELCLVATAGQEHLLRTIDALVEYARRKEVYAEELTLRSFFSMPSRFAGDSVSRLIQAHANRHGIGKCQAGLRHLPNSGPWAFPGNKHSLLKDPVKNLIMLVRF